MSDENTPKLRLRPKLGGGSPPVTPTPAKPPRPDPVPAKESPAESTIASPASKPAAARPKLALKPDGPAPDASGTPMGDLLREAATSSNSDPRSFPPPQAKSLSIPPAQRPKGSGTSSGPESAPGESGATPPFPVALNKEKLPSVLNAPPPPRQDSASPAPEVWPAVLDAPPPPGLSPLVIKSGGEDEPAEITAIRKASTFPFPSPTAKFPPLPGLAPLGNSTAPEQAEPRDPHSAAPEVILKKILLICALVILLLAGAGYGYYKFFVKRPVQPAAIPVPAPIAEPDPAPVALKPKSPQNKGLEKALAAVEKIQQAEPVPVDEAAASVETPVATEPTNAASAADANVPVAAPETPAATETPATPVKPVAPPPSLAFKAWVINLKIRGVRGGDAQRVFIDKTSYVPGEVVNQKLGIIFTGYDENTRMLSFQDQTGATFERRH